MKRGSGQISSIAHADGMLRIQALKEGVGENESVEVELLRDEEDIRRSVVCFGDYDPVLQVLTDTLRESSGIRLVFTAMGGVAALAAVGRGECHFAGFQMRESDAGEDVHAHVKQYLGDIGTSIVKVASREAQYYLVIPDDLRESDGVRELLDAVRSPRAVDGSQ
jgi:putative molybdopterin biosynthesis protein